MILLDGKTASATALAEIAAGVALFTESTGRPPHLAAVLVGTDGGSETYVASKVRHCAQVGMESTLLRFPDTVSEETLLHEIELLNQNPGIDGFIVQLPLPAHISAQKVTEAVSPHKDVDGFHPENLGRMAKGLHAFISATPYGIVRLLQIYGIETTGKHCVVLGRSQTVGLPVSILMERNAYPGNCTVTVCHSKTPDVAYFTRQADIIIAALGIPAFLKADMVKEGAVVVDVGITRIPDAGKKSGYRIQGDVDFENVAPKCSYISPVPGGVGLMTIAALLENTLQAARSKHPL